MRWVCVLGLLLAACDDAATPDDPTDFDQSIPTDAASDIAVDATPDAQLDVSVLDVSVDAMADAAIDAADPITRFYDPEVMQTIALEIAPRDWAAMHAALPQRIYVPGTFRWGEHIVERVGIRFKGNSSSQPQSPFRRSFLIKFHEYVDGQRFLGLRRVALDNGIQFGSLFSEPLLVEILRAEGIIAPRANHAELMLNGQPYGVYVNVERIDDSFLLNRFGNRAGQLYKCDEGGPGADLTRLPQPSDYAIAFEPKTREDEADHRDIAALVTLIHDTPAPLFADALQRRFAVDAFLKMTAIFALGGAFDQYTGWNPHNFYLYDDPATGRWHYLPWDLDVGFADNAFGQIPIIDGWNLAYPLPRVPRPLLQRILENEELLARYRLEADRILETWFRPEIIGPKLDAHLTRLTPALRRDPFPARRATNPQDTGYASIAAAQRAFMQHRYATARAELDDPMIRPPHSPEPQPPPAPGPATPHDPTDLRVVAATPQGVQLQWTVNAEGEAGHIVERCVGADCDAFRPHLPVPGRGRNTAGDGQVLAGETYRYRVYAILPDRPGGRGTGPSNVVTAQP